MIDLLLSLDGRAAHVHLGSVVRRARKSATASAGASLSMLLLRSRRKTIQQCR
jgi:hypothetical protein